MLLNEYLLKVLQVIKLNFRIFSRMKKAEQDFKIDRLTDSILNTISDLGDVRVRFTISEQEYLRIFREYNKENSTLIEGKLTARLFW